MDILINDEKIEYELEHEKSLHEVIDSVEEWVLRNGRVISSISADDEYIIPDSSSHILKKDIKGICILKIQTLSPTEFALHTVGTIGEYIIDLKTRYLQDVRIENHNAILEGLKLIYSGMTGALKLLLVKDFTVLDERGVSLRETLGALQAIISKYEKRYIDAGETYELEAILDGLLSALPRVMGWAVAKNSTFVQDLENADSYYKTALADLCSVTQDSMNKFETIGSNLQIGRDADALEDILFITELLDELVFMLGFFTQTHRAAVDTIRISGKSAREIIESISGGLKKIEESFRNGDMVSVGDMIEYELMPLYGDVRKLIEKISVII